MSLDHADVTGSGAVLLGPHVSCDGFHRDCPVRIQTHVHEDHLVGFNTSKGEQYIYCSHPTKAMLVAEQNADLEYRTNLTSVDYGEWHQHEDCRFSLLENGHMLGSAQVMVEYAPGYRIGYSGDFAGEPRDVIHVETLVLDATCGLPSLVRKYTQAEAEACLLECVRAASVHEPVYIRAHRGTLQRALTVLTGEIDVPMLGSSRLIREVAVYREWGQFAGEVVRVDTDEGTSVLSHGRYVRFYGAGDRWPVDTSAVTTIDLNARVPSDRPWLAHSQRSHTIAFTNHADFQETIDYVANTGAKTVITDCTRSRHAAVLAHELASRLGIDAWASSSQRAYEWGM